MRGDLSTWSLNRSRGAGVSQAGRCPQPGGETYREKGGPDKLHEDRGGQCAWGYMS